MTESMYTLKPVFDLDAKVEVPTCMYSLPVIQSSVPIAGVGQVKAGGGISLQRLEARQDAILSRLAQLKEAVQAYKESIGLVESSRGDSSQVGVTADLVVRCSPAHPAYSLQPALELLQGAGLPVYTACHTHSSLTGPLPPVLHNFLPATATPRATARLRLTLIWAEVGRDCQLMVSPLCQTAIRGEPNLLRYLARLFPSVLQYEGGARVAAADRALDAVAALAWAAPRDRQPLQRGLAIGLDKAGQDWLAGPRPGISDLALYSAVRQLGLQPELQPELAAWHARLTNSFTSTGQLPGSTSSADKTLQQKEKKLKVAAGEKKSKKAENKPATGKESLPSLKQSTSPGKLGKEQLFDFFTQNGIKFTNVDHPEVFTVEAMMPYLNKVEGAICKNLFLKDKKKNLYLLAAAHDKEVKLNDVAKSVGAKELRFGDESVMNEKLGVTQGCVTAFALVNDSPATVKFIVDKALVDGSHAFVNFHPMVNTATTCVSTKDFNKFLKLTGHTVLQF